MTIISASRLAEKRGKKPPGLRQQKKRQIEAQLLVGGEWSNPWNLVFTNELGGHLTHFTVYKYFKQAVAGIGLKEERFHDLRHPYVKQKTKIKSVKAKILSLHFE